jgi:hypothetical protein
LAVEKLSAPMQADSVRRCAFAPLLGTIVMLQHHQNRRNQRLNFAVDLAVGRLSAPVQADSTRRCAFAPLLVTILML